MNFNFILPLQERAFLGVADALWTGDCMEEVLLNCPNKDVTTQKRFWPFKMDEIVQELLRNLLFQRISTIVIPEKIKRKLLYISRCVGLQKIDWYFYHERFLDIRQFPSQFYWTAQGLIDRQKTAEILVKDITIGVCKRYALACFYCIDNEIRRLNGGNPHHCEECTDILGRELRDIWNNIVKQEQKIGADCSEIEHSDEDSRLKENNVRIETFRDAYIYSLEVENSVAAEYVLRKISLVEYNLQEREEDGLHCFKCRPTPYDCSLWLDTSFYLLKGMTKDQQVHVPRSIIFFMSRIFLIWPFHNLFFEAAYTFSHYLTKEDAEDVLWEIIEKKEIFQDFNHCYLFSEFWKILPLSLKEGIMSSFHVLTWFIRSLLKARHAKGLFMVLEVATASQKEDLLLDKAGIETCVTFASNGEWDSLKLFFDSCLPSMTRDSIIKFQKMLKDFLPDDTVSAILKVLDIEAVGI